MKIPKKHKESLRQHTEAKKENTKIKERKERLSYSSKYIIMEELISLFLEHPSSAWHKLDVGKVPTIYYVGLGKSGSTSLSQGFDVGCAHWHGKKHFQEKYGTKLVYKNDICLYDLILYIAKRYKFKPLIIEACREPVIRCLSLISQRMSNGWYSPVAPWNLISTPPLSEERMYDKFMEEANHHVKGMERRWPRANFRPNSFKWNDSFGVDLTDSFDKNKGYSFTELEHVKLLFLRLEDCKQWPTIFTELGYNYSDNKWNSSVDKPIAKIYQRVIDNFKVPVERLQTIYANRAVKPFYSEEEIEYFIEKWKE